MKKNFFRKAVKGWIYGLAMTTVLATGGIEAFAYTTDDHPLVQTSYDGEVFTIVEELPYYENYNGYSGTDYSFWYPKESGTASTGIPYNLPVAGVGQHLYTYERKGLVPVAEWRVSWTASLCQHEGVTSESGYHDMASVYGKCYDAFWSGWFPYCADCGGEIRHHNHYLSRETAESIQYYNVDKGYYYYCPHSDNHVGGHIDQAVDFYPHECKKLSWNMYMVQYYKNAMDATREMAPSFHMYNNETEHDGTIVEPNKYLSPNEFEYKGYTFDSWNTKPDGTGQRFENCQEIFNLTDKEYNEETGEGIITLYAQWRKSESTLIVDAKGGVYDDGRGAINGDETTYADIPYGRILELKEENLTLV